jgi:predicted hydrolase (HD superfamily)
MTHLLNRTEFGSVSDIGNVLSRQEAMDLLTAWVPNERLRLHMLQVGALMRQWAVARESLSEEEAWRWELAGLLHDADWEKYPGEPLNNWLWRGQPYHGEL